MRYTSLTGTARTGTVWSPGPLANSLWVLDDATGEPVVVKAPKGDVGAAHECAYALPARNVDRWGVTWVHKVRDRRTGMMRADSVAVVDYRHAPKLSEKVWRAAVGDQCEQLELTAA